MALLVELSGEQLELASHEAIATASVLADGGEIRVLVSDGPILVLDAPDVGGAELAGRLGLAHRVSDDAIWGTLEQTRAMAATVDIDGVGSFRVRVRRSEHSVTTFDPKTLEAQIGMILKERTRVRVDLESPEVEVRVLLSDAAYVGILGGSVDRTAMEGRAVKYRPFSQPVSIHPKFARAMVNLARVHPGGTVLDPMCGTGGVLIEAAHMGYHAVGRDIDERMVRGSRENLESLGLHASLLEGDVADLPRNIDSEVDAIVTDPPYGRATSTHGEGTEGVIGKLYDAAADILSHGSRLVVCLPDASMLPPEEGSFDVEGVHPMRVHRSLTRHVCVLKRR